MDIKEPKLTSTHYQLCYNAIEAWTSLASNQLSNAFAFQAIRKISKNVLKVMDNPQDVDGRLQLAEASTMAGIAFSNAMVGLVHAMVTLWVLFAIFRMVSA